MINNNRQQNGRRRGRGGQRQGGGNQGNGSRIDNRARGNAAQLLEKYKSLAADAQRQGDRVNTEYYLQFADHYFRVVSEQRGRFEEQDRQRRDTQGGFDSQFDGDDDYDGDEQDQRGDTREAQPREAQRDTRDPQPRDRDGRDGNRDTGRETARDREPRRFDGDREQAGRDNRPPNASGNGNAGGRERVRRDREEPATVALPEGASYASEGEPARAEPQDRPRRARAPRREPAAAAVPADTLDIDRLPPSFAPANDGGDADETVEAKPRRRRLRPATEAGQTG